MAKAKMTKQDYYEAMVRNRFYLWAYTSNVCTLDNLDEVKEGRQYVPLFDEVHLEPCPRPPLKQFVLQEIRAELAIKERQRLRALQEAQAQAHIHDSQQPGLNNEAPHLAAARALLTEGSQEEYLKRRVYRLDLAPHHQPDLAWCLAVLSTLNPKHRFFAKDYTPSREELGNRGKPRKEPEPPLRVDLFYKNLPQHLGRKIPRFIRGPDDEQTDEEEDGDNGSVEDVFGEVHDGRQQPIRNKFLGHGAGKMKSGAQSYRGQEEQKASAGRDQQAPQQIKEKAQMTQAASKRQKQQHQMQGPPQQLFQGGYQRQQQSQSPVRYDKATIRIKAAGNQNAFGTSGSKATTQQSSGQKIPGPHFNGKHHSGDHPHQDYDRFENSGFLIPNSQEHHSVFAEVNGKGGGNGGHQQSSSQHATPIKPTGLYQDPTMNRSQKSNQTMRSANIKGR